MLRFAVMVPGCFLFNIAAENASDIPAQAARGKNYSSSPKSHQLVAGAIL
jgi:hypothetical protein